MRRKKRPPNVLSFHPDTKYITEYYVSFYFSLNISKYIFLTIFSYRILCVVYVILLQ